MRATCFIFTLLLSTNVFAEVYRGPISSGMGGTGRAGIGSGEGAFLNPAVIPLIKNYDFMTTYRDGNLGDGQHRMGWGVGAVDNSEDVLFPGAAHFVRTRESGRTPTPVNGELWHVAGAGLITDRISVGVSAYRLYHRANGSPASTQWNGSLGSVFLLSDRISIAYVLENFARPSGKTPPGLREDLRQSVGTFFRISEFAILRVDASRTENHNEFKRLNYMFGLESATSEFVVFRGGFNLDDQRNRRFWSIGFAFNGPRLRIDYALEKSVEDGSGALHSVDMRVPF